jgi:hypothetical protein
MKQQDYEDHDKQTEGNTGSVHERDLSWRVQRPKQGNQITHSLKSLRCGSTSDGLA